MSAIIDVKGLSRSFKQYKKEPGLKGTLKSMWKRDFFTIDAVKSIDMQIEPGEFVGFIGPNGAGKTTTLKMLSGILHPTGGEVSVAGHVPFRREKDFLHKISLVMGQKSQLWWDLPPLEGFMLNKEIYELDKGKFDQAVKDLSELLDVEAVLKVPMRKLSLGQRMKCELIAALLHNPQILFLDEPTIGLDVVVQKRIREFFRKYNTENETTILLTSHYMEDVAELCSRVIIINHGEKIYDGGLDELMRRYANDKYLRLVFNRQVSQEDLQKYGKVMEYEQEGLKCTLSVERDVHTQVAASILQNLPVDDLDISEVALEDVVRNIFGG